MGDEIANEAGNRLESLPGSRSAGIHHGLAQQVTVGPVRLITGQPQPFEPPFERSSVGVACSGTSDMIAPSQRTASFGGARRTCMSCWNAVLAD
jgi:hypothetical protein